MWIYNRRNSNFSGCFCAINANYVSVNFKQAAAEDVIGATVEVKNSNGAIVEVKALDIAAGDTTADFEFVTAVKAADLEGTWTVDGKSYDLDLFNKLADFLNATTQVELNKALTALNIANIEVANLPNYLVEQAKIEVDATELTVADVQKLVNDVNKANLSAEEEAALVEAIVDAVAAENEVLTLSTLEDAGITPLNSDWAYGLHLIRLKLFISKNNSYRQIVDTRKSNLNTVSVS